MAGKNFVDEIISELSSDGGIFELLFRVYGTLDGMNFRIVNDETDENHIIGLSSFIGKKAYMHYTVVDGIPQYEAIYRDTSHNQEEIRLGTVPYLKKENRDFFHKVFGDKDFAIILTDFKDEGSQYYFDSSLSFRSKTLCYQYVWRYGEKAIPVKDKSVEGTIKLFSQLIDLAENNGDVDSLNLYKDTIGNLIIESKDKDKPALVKLFSKVGKARDRVLKSKKNEVKEGNYFDSDEFRNSIGKLKDYIRQRKATWADVYYFLKPYGLGEMSKSKFGKFIQDHGGPSYKTVSGSGNYDLKGVQLKNELGTINSLKAFFPGAK